MMDMFDQIRQFAQASGFGPGLFLNCCFHSLKGCGILTQGFDTDLEHTLSEIRIALHTVEAESVSDFKLTALPPAAWGRA